MSDEESRVEPCAKCGAIITVHPPECGLLPDEHVGERFAVHNWLLCERTRQLQDLRARLRVGTARVPSSVKERLSRRGWVLALAGGPPWHWLPRVQLSNHGFGWCLLWLWWGLYLIPKSMGEIHARFLCHQVIDVDGDALGMLESEASESKDA